MRILKGPALNLAENHGIKLDMFFLGTVPDVKLQKNWILLSRQE